jgi:sedoheptulose-bisphosphatase
MVANNSTSQVEVNAYSNLADFLRSSLTTSRREALCGSVLPTLVQCISVIGESLRSSQTISLAGTANAFGDDQLNVDVMAEEIIRKGVAKCPEIVTASSEEDPIERPTTRSDPGSSDQVASEIYTIAFDPLDGSSIIAPNFAVGTIIGIWEGPTALGQLPSQRQVASMLGVFGPRTTVIIALRVPGEVPVCLEVGLGGAGIEGACQITRSDIKLANPPFKTRYFAPANLRAAAEDKKYMDLIAHFVQQKYTLRYSGGLVPDVVHALVKGQGVYISPVTSVSKAKLRRLYELAPIALIVECAGGLAVDPADGKSILERAIEDCDERAGLVCGTAEEVELVRQIMG